MSAPALAAHLVSTRVIIILLLPALLLLTLFVGEPFIMSIVFSFTNLRLGSPLATEFVAMQQYKTIFTDDAFQTALVNNIVFAFWVVPAQTVLALTLAMALNKNIYGKAFFRVLFFMPVVFPLSLIAVIWVIIFSPGPEGLMNMLLNVFTLGNWQARDFLNDPNLALPAIMLTSIWQGVGFQMIIFLAALQSIPQYLYEAASLDGANRWQQFWHISLPQLKPTIVYVVLLTTILAFRLFDQVQIMTQGGPNNHSTTIMYEAVKSSFYQQQVARGSAITVILFFIVLLFTWIQQKSAKRIY